MVAALAAGTLRHLYASLIHDGESMKVVQKRLGHKSATETPDTYGHLWIDSEGPTRAAVKSFPALVAWSTTLAGG